MPILSWKHHCLLKALVLSTSVHFQMAHTWSSLIHVAAHIALMVDKGGGRFSSIREAVRMSNIIFINSQVATCHGTGAALPEIHPKGTFGAGLPARKDHCRFHHSVTSTAHGQYQIIWPKYSTAPHRWHFSSVASITPICASQLPSGSLLCQTSQAKSHTLGKAELMNLEKDFVDGILGSCKAGPLRWAFHYRLACSMQSK